MESSSAERQTGRTDRSARRRLIRGAFGAPAALTLYSGSALAATSLTCVAKQVDNPVNPAPSSSDTSDLYVRVQVRAKGSNDTRTTWVFGGDLLLAASLTTADAGRSFLGSDKRYALSAGNGSVNNSGYTAGMVYTNAGATNGGTPAPLANSFVALRFDSTGQIVGVTTTANASAVARSCWNSFVRTI